MIDLLENKNSYILDSHLDLQLGWDLILVKETNTFRQFCQIELQKVKMARPISFQEIAEIS